MSHYKINEHKFVTSDNEILAECEAFYTELHENVIYRLKSEFFQPENDIILNYSDAGSCEGPLTEKECPEALKIWIVKNPLGLINCMPIFTKFSGRTCLQC